MYNFDALHTASAHYRRAFDRLGVTTKLDTNFTLAAYHIEQMKVKRGDIITPHFSPETDTFFQEDAFWLGAFDGDGQCVGMVACKVQRLGDESLVEYSSRYWPRIYPQQEDGAVALSEYQKKAMQAIKGTVIYCGEFRVVPDWQKKGLGVAIADYIKPLSFLKWRDAEMFYIYMEDKDARTGLFNNIDLPHQVRNALRFSVAPSKKAKDYWLGSIYRSDLYDLINHEIAECRMTPSPITSPSP